METVRIGVIGCGLIAGHHAQRILGIVPGGASASSSNSAAGRMLGIGADVYSKIRGLGPRMPEPPPRLPPIEGAEIVAAADIDPGALDRFRGEFGVPNVYTAYQDLLANDDVDAVLISTPPNLHAPITEEAAARGKDIFCEKPMALTSADCTRMIEAARDAGVLLQIGYVLRFSTEAGTIRDSILRGDMGRPLMWRQIMNPGGGAPARWVHDFDVGRGLLWEDSHYLDFMIHTFGDPLSVYAIGDRLKPEKTTAPDAIAAAIVFKSGDKALFTHSYSLPGFGEEKLGMRRNWMQIDIIGPKGYIQFPDRELEGNLTVVRYSNDGEEIAFSSEWTSSWGANGYRKELEHFVQCVREGKPTQMPGEEARRVIILLEGILESMEAGEVCRFEGRKPAL